VEINKIVATRCHILRPKCTKFNFGWGSAQEPAEGAYSAPPDPLAEFKRAYFQGKGGEGGEGKGMEGKGRTPCMVLAYTPLTLNPG